MAKRRKIHEGLKLCQPHLSVVFRLLARTREEGANRCWMWQGATDKDGYGTISIAGKKRWVHRVSYAAFKGPIPDGMTVNHDCHVAGCINPHHLSLMNHSENSRRNNGLESEPQPFEDF